MIGAFIAWSDRKNSPGYVIDGSGCHIWTGCRNKDGYAVAYADGRKQTAYRVRYEREVGPIPSGMQLDHYVCNNGPGGCCNPLHCRPVTQRENVLRGNGAPARNARMTHCKRGHEFRIDPSGRRICRKCTTARQLRYMRNRRAREREARNSAQATNN